MKHLKHTIFGSMLLFICLLASCGTIKEYPDENPTDPTLIEVSISVRLTLDIERLARVNTYSPLLEGDHDIRYIVDIYRQSGKDLSGEGERVVRIVQTDDELTEGDYTINRILTLPAEKYRVFVWADFVRKGGAADLYYKTEDLRAVRIIRDNGYTGYSTTKDAFSAAVDMDLSPYSGQRFVNYPLSVTAVRPFGVYQIITTDIEKYMSYNPTLSYASIRPGITKFAYQSHFPTGYNVKFGVPDDFKQGVGYRFDITETVPQSEAVVASDMVFVNGSEAAYDAAIEICTPDGTHINSTDGIRINLLRNKLTIIRGEFLTRETGGGGIGIDPGFEDEIIVPIN